MSEIITLRLEGWGEMGEALATYEGQPAYVFGGVPGEEVRAEVIHRFRTYIAARVVEAISPSPHRVSPSCSYYGECTGCQWQHLRYEHQLELKRKAVEDALSAEGLSSDVVSPVVAAKETLGYRNHARFTVRREGTLGFVNRFSRHLVRIDRCLIMCEGINRLMGELQGHCAETTQLAIRYGVNTGSWLIQPPLKNVPIDTGQKHYTESLSGRQFRISAGSFFQVNPAQAERMVELIRERLALTGREVVVDAYAGVGTFAALLAPQARKIIAIEEAPSAVADARTHTADLPNVELVYAKTEAALASLPEKADAVILDPPRAGCHPAVIAALNTHPPQKIIYVSCDPKSLARDLRVLVHGPFAVKEVLPVDLFPHTHHIECLATLEYDTEQAKRFGARQHLILASASPRRQEILKDMGIEFQAVPSRVEEENPATSGEPVAVALAQARRKARAVAVTLGEGTVIGADTIVVDGKDILGKPSSPEEAIQFLQRLRGKPHRVVTALAVIDAATGEELTGYCTSKVFMRNYSDAEISAYGATGSPLDKAGAYGIQDTPFSPVSQVRGCYLNVVGLPACTMLGLLYKMGVHPRVKADWKPEGECKECREWGRVSSRRYAL